jgi:hypothetical protein
MSIIYISSFISSFNQDMFPEASRTMTLEHTQPTKKS